MVSKDGLFLVAITVRLSTYKVFYYHYIQRKYFISIYVIYYLHAASSAAGVISLQFIKLIHKNYYACL